MSPNICYLSTNTVQPASPDEATGRIDLTPWDLNCLTGDYIQMGLLFLKPQTQEEQSTLVPHLLTSFSRTLDYFLPLTGRLATEKREEDNTTSFYIDTKVVGAQFIHASANVTIAHILESDYVPEIVHSFFPLHGLTNYDGRSQPLLAVQVTELVNGIFIGCSMNHVIADGTSFWHFMNSWSAICRSLDHIPRLPIFKRCVLNNTDYPIRFQSSIENVFKENKSPPVRCEKVFHFTQQKLAQLKYKANEEGETNQISTLQALLGHVWLNVTRARKLDPNEMVIYVVVAGNRTRLDPPLPEEYFGNSIQLVGAAATAGELLEKGLGWAAWQLNQAVRSHCDAGIRNKWDIFIKEPGFQKSSNGPLNLLMTGSFTGFNLYGNDFGWGRPIGVRSRRNRSSNGGANVNPGAAEGSMEVELCLAPETFKAMEEYSDFTEVVAI